MKGLRWWARELVNRLRRPTSSGRYEYMITVEADGSWHVLEFMDVELSLLMAELRGEHAIERTYRPENGRAYRVRIARYDGLTPPPL